jgi:hypothetical protein
LISGLLGSTDGIFLSSSGCLPVIVFTELEEELEDFLVTLVPSFEGRISTGFRTASSFLMCPFFEDEELNDELQVTIFCSIGRILSGIIGGPGVTFLSSTFCFESCVWVEQRLSISKPFRR